jgi:DNA-binding protein WhiA
MAGERWASVPSALRSVANLRLKHPYLSLPELAAKARPPLTKSALNHRLRRLEALAGETPPDERRPERRRRLAT